MSINKQTHNIQQARYDDGYLVSRRYHSEYSNQAGKVNMPPKAAYWTHFTVEGVTATCLLGGCKNPKVSLGAKHDAKDTKKRLGK